MKESLLNFNMTAPIQQTRTTTRIDPYGYWISLYDLMMNYTLEGLPHDTPETTDTIVFVKSW